jgi:hypothetical protein
MTSAVANPWIWVQKSMDLPKSLGKNDGFEVFTLEKSWEK